MCTWLLIEISSDLWSECIDNQLLFKSYQSELKYFILNSFCFTKSYNQFHSCGKTKIKVTFSSRFCFSSPHSHFNSIRKQFVLLLNWSHKNRTDHSVSVADMRREILMRYQFECSRTSVFQFITPKIPAFESLFRHYFCSIHFKVE